MQLVFIPRERAGEALALLSPLCERYAARYHGNSPRYSAADVIQSIAAGQCLCWVVVDQDLTAKAIVLAEFHEHANCRVLRIVACAGEQRRRWVHMLAQIEDFARANGCAEIEIIGRKGWAREFPDYKLTHIVLTRTL